MLCFYSIHISHSGTCEDGDIKLVGGNTRSEGLLQVCADEGWFNICDEGWTSSSGDVVCKQLGYAGMYM